MLLLFDIDGTLLHTDGLSKDLFFGAISETFDVEINPGNIPWGGLTDKGIAEFALRQAGVDDAVVQTHLPRAFNLLGRKWDAYGHIDHFTIYPEAVDLLGRLAQDNAHQLAILTANCCEGAAHKLRLSGLAPFFDFLITGDLCSQRNDLPGFVFEQANMMGELSAADCLIIGDTPADIACARAHNMPVVSVATGRYSLEQLAEHQPDLLLASLAPSTDFDEGWLGLERWLSLLKPRSLFRPE